MSTWWIKTGGVQIKVNLREVIEDVPVSKAQYALRERKQLSLLFLLTLHLEYIISCPQNSGQCILVAGGGGGEVGGS